MSKQLSELCSLLVQEIYGELPSRLFSALLKHTRLTLPQLSFHATLPKSAVKNGLAVLIQHNLALYSTASPTSQTTYYQANIRRAYLLVRSGKYTGIVRRRYGKDVGSAFQTLLAAGHTSIPDLQSLFESKPNGNAPNGVSHASTVNHNGDESQNGDGDSTQYLRDLGLMRCFRDYDTMSALDSQSIIERMIAHDHSAFKPPISGPKKQTEFRALVQQYKRKIRDDEDELREPPVTFNSRQLPEKVDDTSNAQRRKKRKLNDGRGYGHERPDEYEIEPVHLRGAVPPAEDDKQDLYHVNIEKLNVCLRSEYLIELCNRNLGWLSSRIYATVLELLEKEIERCYDDLDETPKDNDHYLGTLPSVTSREVAAALDSSLELSHDSGHRPNHLTNGTTSTTSRQLHGPVDPHRVQQVDQHLRLLAEHPTGFLVRSQLNASTRWKVNFHRLTQHLIQSELENTVAARFGALGARIVRILAAKGKLDEKQVAQFGLVRQRDLRAALTAMQEAGFVDTQEVPRDATRQPSRTIYLWAYDAERARSLVLDDTYKAMARLLQRAAHERERLRAVLDKAERSDVAGREEQLLAAGELAALRAWRAAEERLLVQLARQDDLVAVLRDFAADRRDS